ncbi:MAG TPA: hypothetical protein VNT79_13575, partial [Phycisphaerae bacterium]|nr:hypothetical protein [Phycisphaerae bacterium]
MKRRNAKTPKRRNADAAKPTVVLNAIAVVGARACKDEACVVGVRILRRNEYWTAAAVTLAVVFACARVV